MWEDELAKMTKECFERERKNAKRSIPTIRKMMSRRRILKKEMDQNPTNTLKEEIIRLEEQIRHEKWKDANQKMTREIRSIEEGGGIESGAFWEFLKRVEGKKEEKATVKSNSHN